MTKRKNAGIAVIDADYNELGHSRHRRHRGGFIGEIANGMSGVFWIVRHPGKSSLRVFGGFSALCGLAAVMGGVTHLIAGQPGTARMTSVVDPVGTGRVVADLTRPTVVRGAQFLDTSFMNPNASLLLDTQLESTASTVEEMPKNNYRR